MQPETSTPKGPYNQLKFVEYTKYAKGQRRIDAIFIMPDGTTEVPVGQVFTEYDPESKKWSHVAKDMDGNELTQPTPTDYQQKNYLKENARRLADERLEKLQEQTQALENQEPSPEEPEQNLDEKTNDIQEIRNTREKKGKGQER
ncbi:MAG: hypothetical protein FD123_426 [Bacteroidetes bacterium]|nr:MAG: hypothetical protein FD123_426 [Bacteroidota bacterium]